MRKIIGYVNGKKVYYFDNTVTVSKTNIMITGIKNEQDALIRCRSNFIGFTVAAEIIMADTWKHSIN